MTIEKKVDEKEGMDIHVDDNKKEKASQRGEDESRAYSLIAVSLAGLTMMLDESMRNMGYLMFAAPPFVYAINRVYKGIKG